MHLCVLNMIIYELRIQNQAGATLAPLSNFFFINTFSHAPFFLHYNYYKKRGFEL